jgi:hypothetical protein
VACSEDALRANMFPMQETGEEDKTTIKHLDCETAHKTLGLREPRYTTRAPLGKKQRNITSHSNLVSHKNPSSNIMELNIYPRSCNPLAATHFKEKDLNRIENKALMTFLPKIGYNRHTPAKSTGLRTQRMRRNQHQKPLRGTICLANKCIHPTSRLNSPLEEILSINTDWVKLIAGIAKPVIAYTKKLHHMEGEWFISIWEFLHLTDCQIKVATGWLPQKCKRREKNTNASWTS